MLSYAEKLPEEAKKRYQDKLKVISSIDPFLLQAGTHSGETSSLPSVDAADLVSYSYYKFYHSKTV